MQKFYMLSFVFLFLASSMQAQVVWDNFEDQRKGTYGFISGSFIPYAENAAPGGTNTSTTAATYTRNPAETFDVIILDAEMADLSDYLSGNKQMSIDVFSPAAGITIQITLENSVLAQPANFPTGRHSVYLATTTVGNQWETITFSFDNQPDAGVANDNVDRLILLFAPNTNTADTYGWDNLNGPELANDPCTDATPNPQVFNDFECNQNVAHTFTHSGVNFRRVPNPDPINNPSDFVGRYVRNGGEEFDVMIAFFDGNLSLQPTSTLSLDVWDPNAPTTLRLSLENMNGDIILAVDAQTSISEGWETLTFDFSDIAAANDVARFVLLFDPGNFTADEYFFDNFQYDGALAVEELDAVTAFNVFPNPTRGNTTFDYELNASSDVNLSIYDMTGKMVSTIVDARQAAGPHQVNWSANGLANGIYFYTLAIDGKTASGKISLNR